MYGQTLTTNLRLARLRAGIPQFVIARRAKLAPSRLSVLERGYDEPTHSERRALAEVLNLSAEELFPARPEVSAPTAKQASTPD